MKKALLTLVALLVVAVTSIQVYASANFKDDPFESFWVIGRQTTKTTVSWEVAENVNERCQQESRARGNGGFGTKVEACSFWTKNTCHIITGKYTNMHQLGHETRHCFMGAYH